MYNLTLVLSIHLPQNVSFQLWTGTLDDIVALAGPFHPPQSIERCPKCGVLPLGVLLALDGGPAPERCTAAAFHNVLEAISIQQHWPSMRL
jgi:hypothetical protein